MSQIVLSQDFSIEKFDDIIYTEHRKIHDGDQALIFFKNQYGASVVRHSHSYGGSEGFYEIAVIEKADEGSVFDGNFELAYDTPITEDVLGWLTADQVVETLNKIRAL